MDRRTSLVRKRNTRLSLACTHREFLPVFILGLRVVCGYVSLMLRPPCKSTCSVQEPFLYYEEKEPTTKEEKEAKAARRCANIYVRVCTQANHQRNLQRASRNPEALAPPSSRRQDRPTKTGGLTKQTYSIYVNLGPISRKWHLVAYFSVRPVPFPRSSSFFSSSMFLSNSGQRLHSITGSRGL
jgi:hypothetical protein